MSSEREEGGTGGALARSKGRRRGLLRGLALALAALLIGDQALLFLGLADGYLRGRRIAPFDPPLFDGGQLHRLAVLEAHLRTGEPGREHFLHDGELGWAPPHGGTAIGERFDWAGARIGLAPLAREKSEGVRRIVAVGCSFTFGDEVGGDETWAARLDELREDLELANLGMGAYGIDQALLRYLRDGRPLAPDEVWLGFMPSAALRVTTLFRPAHRHWDQTVLFKPRFVLDAAGELALVPNPGHSLERTYELLTRQEEFFAALIPHDAWVRRCPAAYAPAGSRLAHHSGFARLALTALEAGGRDALAALADADGELERLLLAIVLRARDEASKDGARLRFLILPSAADIERREENRRAPWESLCAKLTRLGVDVLDLGLDLPAPADPGWKELWAPGGHYSPAGNRRVAEALARRVE